MAPFVSASTLVGLLLPALVLTRLVDGPAGVRDLWRRAVTPPSGLRWYAFALVVVPLAALALPAALLGPPSTTPTAVVFAVWAGLLVPTLVGLVTTNLAEEVAWTGFVQTRLQARHGPSPAALLTAPLFALQPLVLVVGNPDGLLVLGLLVGLAVPFRALLGWLDNRTGSFLLVGLVHAPGNATAGGGGTGPGLVPLLYPGERLGPVHLVALALLGLVVLAATRGRLGRMPGRRCLVNPAPLWQSPGTPRRRDPCRPSPPHSSRSTSATSGSPACPTERRTSRPPG